MSNTIEFRQVIVKKNTDPGSGETITWEYRTKDTIISILGVSLSSWSDWTRVESVVIWQDDQGNPI